MITYSIAKESNYEEINNFYNKYKNINRTLKQFYWEFHNAPAGKSIYVYAKDNDLVIGILCVIPINFITKNNKRVLSGKAEDGLVHPDYRGKGILNKIYDVLFEECKLSGINIIWGFTNIMKPFIKLGWEVPFSYTHSLFVIKPLRTYNLILKQNFFLSIKDKTKLFLLCYGLKLKNSLIHKEVDLNDYYIIEEKNIDVENLITSIWEKNHFSYIEHSKEYLEWRIYKNPYYEKVLTFSLYNVNGSLQGVIYINYLNDGRAFIIESLFAPILKTEIISSFIRNVNTLLQRKGISTIRNWIFSHIQYSKQEQKYYKNAKFFNLRKGGYFVWKKLNDVDIEPNEIYLSRIASEGTI